MTVAQTHLVTGGSGFVAQHLVNDLLQRGLRVHTTVRSLGNAKKVDSLKTLQERYPAGQLRLFEADLLEWGSFKEAMQGCSVVHHVASPFLMAEKIKDGQKECVEPALKGTQNVLATVGETEAVERVVLTSTSKFVPNKQPTASNLGRSCSGLSFPFFFTDVQTKPQSVPYSAITPTSKIRWQGSCPRDTSTRPAQ